MDNNLHPLFKEITETHFPTPKEPASIGQQEPYPYTCPNCNERISPYEVEHGHTCRDPKNDIEGQQECIFPNCDCRRYNGNQDVECKREGQQEKHGEEDIELQYKFSRYKQDMQQQIGIRDKQIATLTDQLNEANKRVGEWEKAFDGLEELRQVEHAVVQHKHEYIVSLEKQLAALQSSRAKDVEDAIEALAQGIKEGDPQQWIDIANWKASYLKSLIDKK